MGLIIGAGIFISVILLIGAGSAMLRNIQESDAHVVRRRLRTLSAGGTDIAEVDIIRRKIFSDIPWLNDMLLRITRVHSIDRLLEQANTKMPVGFFLLLSLVLAAAGLVGGAALRLDPVSAIVVSVLLAALPVLYLFSRKQRRMNKFQEQLPDALDLVARALRAGHAFSGGLKMVAGEFNDPVGTEFAKTLDEISFGVGVEDALKNLAKRVDCPDLQFFVVSVIVQRETGGNLAEILEKIAHLIRERFKFHGKIRTLSAEGRFSAIILIGLPFFIAFVLTILNPKYIGVLVTDPIGKMLVAAAILLIIAGVIVMKRMIAIRV